MRNTLLPADAPRLGLGLAALGRPGYINLGHGQDLGAAKDIEAMRQRTFCMLDAAWAAGMRYFDAARSYGLAEAFLGEWLRDREHSAVVGSKWGYTYVAGWRTDADTHEVKDHSLNTLQRQWPETLEALGRRPEVYLIHSATLDTGVLEDQAVLARLAELDAAGVRVGLSTSGPRQADTLRRAMALQVEGLNPLSVVQATWNLLEPSAGPALAEAHAAGWAVVIKEAVANGRLTARGLTGHGDVPPVLAELADKQNATPDAVALAAALTQPWADVVLSGATTPEHLENNLGALHLSLTPVHQEQLMALAYEPTAYWQARSGLPWT
ncbi:aldo/keto reductase [Deinococcus deserti]|uniref:Putative oxidoreductase n=1 Tax=Deinococcus deserti (strain DSM 17065 / CIP 109153 / LMG 22923 / VCD115) TaxID=546414 RepID=C1D027_DEIDV|nr:aldo/keto reductase [Deinococcus deserti]ACO45279.2 putative oxidoreductase [Deinococcus deserti VCD115]